MQIAKRNPRWGFFWQTGTGKTLLGLAIIQQKAVKSLAVAPKILLRDAWLSDARKFFPDLYGQATDWHNVKNKHNREKIIRDTQLLIINYESLLSNSWILDYDWQLLILDESQAIKDPKSKITKLITKKCINIPYIYLLSGTPAPNNELEYWGQLRLLLPDEVDRSWFKFRQKYFIQVDKFGWKWELYRKQEFYNLLKKCSSVVKKEDVLDLKGQFYRVVNYSLSLKERKHYNEMLRDLVTEIEEQQITAQMAVTKLMKLRQILSGFVYDLNGQAIEIDNSKLNSLQQLIEMLGSQQVIIWTQYKHEAKQISNLLQKINKTYSVITGEVNFSHRHKILSQFRNGNLQILVAHPRTIGHGVTLTNVSNVIYYSLDYSYEAFTQSQDRVYRYGQENPVMYYILLEENRKIIDNKIYYDVLQKKENKLETVLEIIREVPK